MQKGNLLKLLLGLTALLTISAILLKTIKTATYETSDAELPQSHESLNFNVLVSSNTQLNTFMEALFSENPGITLESFSLNSVREIKRERSYPADYPKNDDSYWSFSPDGKSAVSSLLEFGSPDSSLNIYEVDTGNISQIAYCGTPCSYWGTIWLDTERFVFIQEVDMYGNGPIVLSIVIYNIKENKVYGFTTDEIPQRLIKPYWKDWEDRITLIKDRLGW
jgi:hypothetical protein